jgi:hypothetical protein
VLTQLPFRDRGVHPGGIELAGVFDPAHSETQTAGSFLDLDLEHQVRYEADDEGKVIGFLHTEIITLI